MTRAPIVGASRGIGLELVRQYREAGCAVTATARSADGLARRTVLGAEARLLDLAKAADVSAPAWLLQGDVFDVVLLCAGRLWPAQPRFADTHAGRVRRRHAHQCAGRDARAAAGGVDAGTRGAAGRAVVTAGSSSACAASPAAGRTRASKAALNSVLKDTSLVLAGQAICVALTPGWVRTDMGGANGDIDVHTSVADIRRLLAGLTAADHGGFFNHDGQPPARRRARP